MLKYFQSVTGFVFFLFKFGSFHSKQKKSLKWIKNFNIKFVIVTGVKWGALLSVSEKPATQINTMHIISWLCCKFTKEKKYEIDSQVSMCHLE